MLGTGDNELDQMQQEPSQHNQAYIVHCNKWRPYYYDMFNRAGNLTILSLGNEANTLIENLPADKNQSNTWHDRLKKKAATENVTDFASIRIYWRYPEASKQPDGKACFMFTKNGYTEVANTARNELLQYANLRTKAHLAVPTLQASLNFEPLQKFWQDQIENLRGRYCHFS